MKWSEMYHDNVLIEVKRTNLLLTRLIESQNRFSKAIEDIIDLELSTDHPIEKKDECSSMVIFPDDISI